MTDKPKGRGGRREPPGGRPPKSESEKRIKLSITLSLHTVEYIKKQRKRPREPISQVIERLLSSDERNDP